MTLKKDDAYMYTLTYRFVPDDIIVAAKSVKNGDEEDSVIYIAKGKRICKIDLNECVENFQKEFGIANGRCVGDCDINNGYFLFYTSGMKTKIEFKRFFVFNVFGKRLMCGSRSKRFDQFASILCNAGFTTRDM